MALHELFTIPFLKAVFENVIDQLIKKDIFINGALFIHRPITLAVCQRREKARNSLVPNN